MPNVHSCKKRIGKMENFYNWKTVVPGLILGVIIFPFVINGCDGRKELNLQLPKAQVMPKPAKPKKNLGPTCGNKKCESINGETMANCEADCGVICGDGYCGLNEAKDCPKDCNLKGYDCSLRRKMSKRKSKKCGDGICHPTAESSYNCPKDCGPAPKCGDNICQDDEPCHCPKDCKKYEKSMWLSGCGDFYCYTAGGETSFNCAHDCGPPKSICGDGNCSTPLESCSNCPQDCGWIQGCSDTNHHLNPFQ